MPLLRTSSSAVSVLTRSRPARPAEARGTAIVCHGNAGHAGHRSFYAGVLARLGLWVILAEYPGYGPRDGAPGEESLAADAQLTVARAHRSYGAPLVFIRESLGAGVAGSTGSRERDKVTGLLLITPWDRLAHVAAHHYPWLPVKWLLRDRYDSVTCLASFDRPVLVVVAESDSIVPARFGEALYNAVVGPRQLRVEGGGAQRLDRAHRRDLVEGGDQLPAHATLLKYETR